MKNACANIWITQLLKYRFKYYILLRRLLFTLFYFIQAHILPTFHIRHNLNYFNNIYKKKEKRKINSLCTCIQCYNCSPSTSMTTRINVNANALFFVSTSAWLSLTQDSLECARSEKKTFFRNKKTLLQ